MKKAAFVGNVAFSQTEVGGSGTPMTAMIGGGGGAGGERIYRALEATLPINPQLGFKGCWNKKKKYLLLFWWGTEFMRERSIAQVEQS